tara:strand:- start:612 stop:863 length:252 start_codon:yes stop_codon:yes gene_type:complete
MLKKQYKEKGKVPLSKYFQEFNVGDKVGLSLHSSVQTGMYFRRFHGKHGNIIGKKGRCYGVEIKDGGKKKIQYVHPIHLKKTE